MWLILPNGIPLAGSAPVMNPVIEDLLWQANVFDGNVEALLRSDLTAQKRKQLNSRLLDKFLLFKVRTEKQRTLLHSHFLGNSQKDRQKSDPLSFFRVIPDFQTKKKDLDDYHSLIESGITRDEIEKMDANRLEALLLYLEAVKKLKTHRVNISEILKLRVGDLVKILENVDSLIIFLQKGASLSTFIKIVTSPRKTAASAA